MQHHSHSSHCRISHVELTRPQTFIGEFRRGQEGVRVADEKGFAATGLRFDQNNLVCAYAMTLGVVACCYPCVHMLPETNVRVQASMERFFAQSVLFGAAGDGFVPQQGVAET